MSDSAKLPLREAIRQAVLSCVHDDNPYLGDQMGQVADAVLEVLRSREQSNSAIHDDHLKDIRERAEMATPGPWQAHTFTDERILIAPWPPHKMDNGDTVCLNVAHTPFLEQIPMLKGLRSREQTHADAAFIAHAREDVPALLAEIERLRRSQQAKGTPCSDKQHFLTCTCGSRGSIWNG